MTPARLTTAVRVSALIRRVNAEGGHAMVLQKGDPTAGALLLVLCTRGENARLAERVLDEKGDYKWRQIGRETAENPEKMAAFMEKRRKIDPDLWIVELDIPSPERFIEEEFIIG